MTESFLLTYGKLTATLSQCLVSEYKGISTVYACEKNICKEFCRIEQEEVPHDGARLFNVE